MYRHCPSANDMQMKGISFERGQVREMQMAVFLLHTCKFSGCGLTFATLAELIQHIEETHIGKGPLSFDLFQDALMRLYD